MHRPEYLCNVGSKLQLGPARGSTMALQIGINITVDKWDALSRCPAQACPQHRPGRPKVMSRNAETVETVDAQSTSDNIIDQHVLHSKLVRKEKQKRKRVDQDEVEVEAIVVAESNEGGSATRGIVNPERSKKKRGRNPSQLRCLMLLRTKEHFRALQKNPFLRRKRGKTKGRGKQSKFWRCQSIHSSLEVCSMVFFFDETHVHISL